MQLSRAGRLIALAALAAAALTAAVAAEGESSPFGITPTITNNNGRATLVVSFSIPTGHRLYAGALSFEIDGSSTQFDMPAPVEVADRHSASTKQVFAKNFIASKNLEQGASSLSISLHGCNEQECFFPETRGWTILKSGRIAAQTATSGEVTTELSRGFSVSARTSGFQSGQKFLGFLSAGNERAADDNAFAGMNTAAVIGLILLGGIALNLTPCVLPMIPINLAILGAGAHNQNQRRGFALGSAYGAGMTLAYGGVGILVVLTGSKFGALNSSAPFNFSIAAIFIVLGLAMLDRFTIDLSRFQRRGNQSGKSRWALVGAATMGAISALLAGACVAPVVISVLLLAVTFHQQGNMLGLLLPFVLGLGMALPWPFAAAGLSFLPKPGAWMVRVKHGFAVLIFGFALWYGSIGWSLVRPLHASARSQDSAAQNIATLKASLDESRATGRPLLIDFWASWCKNCSAMEQTTLRDREVRKRLEQFIVVKFQAEHLNDAAIKPVLDEFGVMGLPTFILMKPVEQHTASSPWNATPQ